MASYGGRTKWQTLWQLRRFGFWALVTAMGPIQGGFDLLAGQQAIAMPAFQQKFGIPYPSQPSGYLLPATWQSAWIGATFGALAVSELISGWLTNRIGRKHMLIVGVIVNVIGIIVLQTAQNWKIWLVGKMINALGFGTMYVLNPVWIGENAPPAIRGFWLCTLDWGLVFGEWIIVLISKGTLGITNPKYTYMSMIVLEYLFPLFFLIVYPFFPESPYWLLKNGKFDEARKSLNRIHGSHDQAFIDFEMKRLTGEVRESQELAEQTKLKGPPYLQIFQHQNLRRTLSALLPVVSQQLIGASFISGYVTYFFELLGITNTFDISAALFSLSVLMCMVGFFTIEAFGRRTMILPAITFVTLCCMGIGIAGTFPLSNKPAQWSIVVLIFLYQVVYNMTLGVCGLAIPSELGTLPLRTQTQGVIAATQALSGWLILFVTPYMINPDAGNLGGKVGFVFFGFGVICTVLLYFFLPETKGLSFDEIDYCFANKVNARRFPEAAKRYREEMALQGRDQDRDSDKAVGEPVVTEKADA